jgi:oxaloacetate decarboxylase gamma subunit
MTIIEMLEQSMILTVLGMTIVFVFLWVMIICINATGKLVHKMGWDKDIQQQPGSLAAGSRPKTADKTPAAEVTAAISAAITEHRKKE